MMMRGHKIFCIITLVCLLLYPLQQVTRFLPLKPLQGVEDIAERPSFSLSGCCSGDWQTAAEKHTSQHFGFREWAIRIYNQYQWTFYRHSTVESVMVGKKNPRSRNGRYLYERYFVEEYYESRMYKYTQNAEELLQNFDREASRLAKVQQILESQGVYLFVVVPPGKEFIYPEYLPSRDTMTRPKGPTAYERYLPLFGKYGVRHLDMAAWLRRIKDSVPYQVMPQTGTHWSNIAATYAFDSIVRYMEQLAGTDMSDFRLGTPWYDKSRHPDHDLEKLLNLVFPLPSPPDMYLPVEMVQVRPAPRMMVIGDSFFWNIIYNYPLDEIVDWRYWYYYSTVYGPGNYQSSARNCNLVDELLQSRFVMLNYCTAQLYDLGNGFITDALLNLCYNPQQIDSTLDAIMNSMRNTPQWMESLHQKSSEKHLPLDSVMLEDAGYLLYQNPEEYLPELRGVTLPESRNSKLRKP